MAHIKGPMLISKEKLVKEGKTDYWTETGEYFKLRYISEEEDFLWEKKKVRHTKKWHYISIDQDTKKLSFETIYTDRHCVMNLFFEYNAIDGCFFTPISRTPAGAMALAAHFLNKHENDKNFNCHMMRTMYASSKLLKKTTLIVDYEQERPA